MIFFVRVEMPLPSELSGVQLASASDVQAMPEEITATFCVDEYIATIEVQGVV
jgi:hypothetical protein